MTRSPIWLAVAGCLALLSGAGCSSDEASDTVVADTAVSMDSDAEPTPPDTTAPSVDAKLPADTASLDIPNSDAGLPLDVTSDISPPDARADLPCDCSPDAACVDGVCLPIICEPGASQCTSIAERQVCNETGTAWATQPCGETAVCYSGDCSPPVCDVNAAPGCEGGQIATCIDGVELQLTPCPGGTGCLNGTCETVTPNVVLVVDTSGSMSYLWDQPEVWPEDCTENCPPWTFPNCDDPSAPLTRLGRTKLALQAMLNDDLVNNVRLALMRFPQWLLEQPDCRSGHYSGLGVMTGDSGEHQAGAWFEAFLWQVLMVPFETTSADNDVTEMKRWFDFNESFGVDGSTCGVNWDCAQDLCIEGACVIHSDPELRGIGPTPLGKSLFYAGEYLRKEILVEGRPCGDDAECASPHHTCVDGACHDPFHACRPTEVILFTDGQETVFLNKTDYFHPIPQAKRLHFGLGCTADVQCSNGAVCTPDGHCAPPPGTIPEKQCDALPIPCTEDSECPAWNCGDGSPCPGKCEPAAVWVKDPEQQNYLKGEDGLPLPITIHVVDASAGTQSDNALIAAYGGGEHVSVSLGDIAALTEVLLGLLDPKDGPSCGAQ